MVCTALAAAMYSGDPAPYFNLISLRSLLSCVLLMLLVIGVTFVRCDLEKEVGLKKPLFFNVRNRINLMRNPEIEF